MRGTLQRGRGQAFASALVIASALLGVASNAAASSPPSKDVMVSTRSLDLVLRGHLDARCEASGGGVMDFGSALRGGMEIRAGFGLDCNIPFALKIASSNGGLAHATSPRGHGPFAGTLRYTMDVRVPTLTAAGPGADVGGSFGSEARSQTFFSGLDSIAAGGGVLSILTQAPEGAGLLAGSYTDTVTITVTAI